METVIRRHKTLGAWVPVWGPGPCRNPACGSRAGTAPEAAPDAGAAEPHESAPARQPDRAHDSDRAHDPDRAHDSAPAGEVGRESPA